MIAFLITVIKLLLILGVVATIHELGHFLAAKFFKIGVEEFSIGFGPKIFQKEHKGTKYSLRWIPLGGFCAIEGEEGNSFSETAFSNKNTLVKIIVLSMGVIFNVILSIIIFLAVAMNYPTNTTTIETFAKDSIVENGGVQVGDTITAINGEKTRFQSDLISKNDVEGTDLEIEYTRNGVVNKIKIANAIQNVGYIGAAFVSDSTGLNNQIELVSSGSPANKAGLKAKDVIISINDEQVNTPKEIIDIIRLKPDQKLIFKIKRNNETIEKTVDTKSKKFFDLGIESTKSVKTTIPMSFSLASNNVGNIVGSYVDLFKGKVKLDNMSGLVGIGEIVSKTNGVLEFFNLMGIICLAVGIANIMPFPPLDGGKIVIVLGEAITRRKISEKVELIISYIGFGLLILLTIVVTFNDIIRIL